MSRSAAVSSDGDDTLPDAVRAMGDAKGLCAFIAGGVLRAGRPAVGGNKFAVGGVESDTGRSLRLLNAVTADD